MKILWRAQVENHSDGIERLEIGEADGGFYLFQFDAPDGPAKWDTFYQTLEDVFEDGLDFGVPREGWRSVET